LLILIPGREELSSNVYWTAFTRSGCAGKFTNCFEEEIDLISLMNTFDFDIITSKEGGACVALIRGHETFVAKTIFCDQKVSLGCQPSIQTVNSPIDKVKKTLSFYLTMNENFWTLQIINFICFPATTTHSNLQWDSFCGKSKICVPREFFYNQE